MALRMEVEREEDGRWIAEVTDLPGVLAYGDSQQKAIDTVKALTLRVIADRIEHGESAPEPVSSIFSVRGVSA